MGGEEYPTNSRQDEIATSKAFAVRCAVAPLNLFLRARDPRGGCENFQGPISCDRIWWRLVDMLGCWDYDEKFGVPMEKLQAVAVWIQAEELDFEYDDLPCKATRWSSKPWVLGKGEAVQQIDRRRWLILSINRHVLFPCICDVSVCELVVVFWSSGAPKWWIQHLVSSLQLMKEASFLTGIFHLFPLKDWQEISTEMSWNIVKYPHINHMWGFVSSFWKAG